MKVQSQKTPRCPICKKPEVAQFRPFCSEHCKLVDLGQWLKGSYVVKDPSEEIADPKSNNYTPEEPDN